MPAAKKAPAKQAPAKKPKAPKSATAKTAAHGGARAGAGRKAKADKFAPQIARAEKRIADRLPELIDNMLHLANGGYQRVEEKLEWAELRDDEGKIVRDEKGDAIKALVPVERKVTIADRDLGANRYLIDRILGAPTKRLEHEFTQMSDEELIKAAETALRGDGAAGA